MTTNDTNGKGSKTHTFDIVLVSHRTGNNESQNYNPEHGGFAVTYAGPTARMAAVMLGGVKVSSFWW
jgi:hypothetical protein